MPLRSRLTYRKGARTPTLARQQSVAASAPESVGAAGATMGDQRRHVDPTVADVEHQLAMPESVGAAGAAMGGKRRRVDATVAVLEYQLAESEERVAMLECDNAELMRKARVITRAAGAAAPSRSVDGPARPIAVRSPRRTAVRCTLQTLAAPSRKESEEGRGGTATTRAQIAGISAGALVRG
jgi:hypothetical protein